MGLNPHQSLWTHNLQLHRWKKLGFNADLPLQSAGVAPEVNLRITTGEKAQKQGIHPGFETHSRRNQKFETGVSLVPQKGLVSSKDFKQTSNDIGMAEVNDLRCLCLTNFCQSVWTMAQDREGILTIFPVDTAIFANTHSGYNYCCTGNI